MFGIDWEEPLMPRRIPRLSLLDRFISLVGGDAIKVVEPGDGWPSIVKIRVRGKFVLAALHLAAIHGSYRHRDAVEVRFQNPGQDKPIASPPRTIPLLIGVLEEETPVLAGMEVEHRIGATTRQSLFVPVWGIREAQLRGWAEKHNNKGELIICFNPPLLPTYVEMRRVGVPISANSVAEVISETGLLSNSQEEPIERARRASMALVRSAAFTRKVVNAYSGMCAMCGLSLGIVQAAHIYPVGAPGSPDQVWNGLALCGNHHAAFDRHLIWISPIDFGIKIHPTVVKAAKGEGAAERFVLSTFKALVGPKSASQAPQPEMLSKRYQWFKRQYSWHRFRA